MHAAPLLSTAGDLHGLPERVLAPQRGLRSIGPVLRDDCRSFNWFRLVGTLMEGYDRDALQFFPMVRPVPNMALRNQ
jgi:hypothetical protein